MFWPNLRFLGILDHFYNNFKLKISIFEGWSDRTTITGLGPGMPNQVSEGGSTFREIPQGGGFDCTILASGGVRLQDFRREAPEIGAEGAVLENFCDFSEKLLLKNEGKSENLGVWG